VRLVLEIADGIPLGLANTHCWDTEIAPTEVGILSPYPACHLNPSLDWGIFKRDIFYSCTTKVVGNEVPRELVDVEPVC
jgi:hypothetical protein